MQGHGGHKEAAPGNTHITAFFFFNCNQEAWYRGSGRERGAEGGTKPAVQAVVQAGDLSRHVHGNAAHVHGNAAHVHDKHMFTAMQHMCTAMQHMCHTPGLGGV